MFLSSTSLNLYEERVEASTELNISHLPHSSQQLKIYDVSAGNHDKFFHFATNVGVFCRGTNEYGQLGLGHPDSMISTFMRILQLNNAKISSVRCGSTHTLFLGCGQPWSAGYNQHGECAQDISSNERNGQRTVKRIPLHLFGNKSITKIGAGDYHSLSLTDNNELYICGYNGFHTLGLGSDTDNKATPVRLKNPDWAKNRITDISCGQWHSCVLTNDGKVYSWGYNAQGQLASKKIKNSQNGKSPARAIGNEFVTHISCGFTSTSVVIDGTNVKVYGTGHSKKITPDARVTCLSSSFSTAFVDSFGNVYTIYGKDVKVFMTGTDVKKYLGNSPSVVCAGSDIIIFNKDIPNDNEILFTESLLKIVNNGTLVDITIKTKFL